jgi:hypothetical protein
MSERLAILTAGRLADGAAKTAAEAEAATGLPGDDVVRYAPARVLDAILDAIPAQPRKETTHA